MSQEIVTDLPKIKWRIVDEEKAKEAKIEVIDINKDTAFLCINIRDIPKGCICIAEYIEMILDSGIVIVDRKE